MAAGSSGSLLAALPAWWRVARQWFTGPDSRRARAYAAASVALAVCNTLVAVRVSYAQKRFSTGLAERKRDMWLAAVYEFVGIILLAAPVRALDAWTERRMAAVWRASLSQAFITAYCSQRAYFNLQLARGTEGEQPAEASPGRPQQLGPARAQPQLLGAMAGAAGGGAGGKGAAAAAALDATAAAAAAAQEELVAGFSEAAGGIDNPDQRMTADCASFVSTSVRLALLLLKKLLHCVAFAGVLYSISPRLVFFLLVYAFAGTFGTAAVFGRPLTRLQQQVLKLEADLRFALVRLRENAEAVAFYGGDAREAGDLSQRLAAMVAVLLRRINWLGGYELWVTAYGYSTILLPSLVLAPQYFAGDLEFGILSQASYAFRVLEEALGLLLANVDEFSALAAETVRLAGLLDALRAADADAGGRGQVLGFDSGTRAAGPKQRGRHWGGGGGGMRWLARLMGRGSGGSYWQLCAEEHDEDADAGSSGAAAAAGSDVEVAMQLLGSSSSSGAQQRGGSQQPQVVRVSKVLRLMDGSEPGLSVAGLTACVPGRHHQRMVVCAGLSFSLAPGESLLVVGPSGCGKSSLLRIMAGLWSVGAGCVRGPAQQHVFFLPQRPYMPLGSLRQQLVFPRPCSSSSSGASPAAAAAAAARPGSPPPPHQHLKLSPEPPPAGQGRERGGDVAAVGLAGSQAGRRRGGGGATPAGTPRRVSADADTDGAGAAGGAAALDSQLQLLLQQVALDHLLTRYPGGLHTVLDWASVLSLGEQQRVALVRLLHHRPLLAFLDEATAALDPASEAAAYALVRSACMSFVSVGHRPQLLEWHTHVLANSGCGAWQLYTAAAWRQRLAAGQQA